MRKNTVKIVSVVVLGLTISFSALADGKELTKQEKKELRKEKKAIRKAEREMYDKALHEQAYQALKDLDFVLEAHTVQGKRGKTINVSDNLNFISVEEDKATLQLAFRGYGGPNGLGGITLNGRISNKKYSTDKHGNKFLKFNVMGAALHAEVRIDLNASNNYANAYVEASTRSGKIQFHGRLVPKSETRTYKSGFDI
ncbi:DUF4251 domain-containing protein [Marinifilum caeruleilacunae]|uniref:DUF4251 domain-containing protein n=1 Tax=Marinifilum caeruleilacunae TaxID=2499076 RepID=A0ABX1WW60_9BACT|nr:DUF4251 domain-containing protein [Marinifilum caeruleilacunae]NOU60128.1 DUF4251 domain-containing protein [Marinifilum caeruleilacunae]